MKTNLKTISTRMDNEALAYLDEVTKKFNLDRPTAIRMIFKKGLDRDRQERALELYSKGKLSLSGATKFANMYIGEFLELMKEYGVESNLTLEDFKEGLKNLNNIVYIF